MVFNRDWSNSKASRIKNQMKSRKTLKIVLPMAILLVIVIPVAAYIMYSQHSYTQVNVHDLTGSMAIDITKDLPADIFVGTTHDLEFNVSRINADIDDIKIYLYINNSVLLNESHITLGLQHSEDNGVTWITDYAVGMQFFAGGSDNIWIDRNFVNAFPTFEYVLVKWTLLWDYSAPLGDYLLDFYVRSLA